MADILSDASGGGNRDQVRERELGMTDLLNPSTTERTETNVEVREQGVGSENVVQLQRRQLRKPKLRTHRQLKKSMGRRTRRKAL
ncbi:hypothetical protein PC116_g8884 [Phytophthora cactorum]|nr:hypothetical protein PC116_g8884 [Phytophthora cactorum]